MNWTDRVRENLNEVTIQQSLRVAATSTLIVMGPRIFERGQRPDGSSIGEYSTRPLVIEKKDMASTSGGDPAGPSAKFFSGGYKQYKESLGRGKVFDMRNFGVMMRDFYSGKQTFTGNTVTVTFKEQRNIDIINEDDRMKKALGMSKTERDEFNRVFNYEFLQRTFPK